MSILRLLLLLSPALSACRSPEPRPVKDEVSSRPRTPDGTECDDNYAGKIEPALAQAEREGKFVLLYFFTQITDGYERFQANVLSDPAVAHWIDEQAVFVDVDMDWEPDLVRRFRPRDSGDSLLLTSQGETLRWLREQYGAGPYLAELEAATAAGSK